MSDIISVDPAGEPGIEGVDGFLVEPEALTPMSRLEVILDNLFPDEFDDDLPQQMVALYNGGRSEVACVTRPQAFRYEITTQIGTFWYCRPNGPYQEADLFAVTRGKYPSLARMDEDSSREGCAASIAGILDNATTQRPPRFPVRKLGRSARSGC